MRQPDRVRAGEEPLFPSTGSRGETVAAPRELPDHLSDPRLGKPAVARTSSSMASFQQSIPADPGPTPPERDGPKPGSLSS